ncbi:hypothetical protein [Pontibacter chitinilyticus]|uniref:hypothetical protein n=1 Tax=Pontibacter chitinilyticus TaxID=2674989 RepID=UPI00321A6F98
MRIEQQGQASFASEAEPLELKNSQGVAFLHLFYKRDFLVARWFGYITAEDVVLAASAYLDLMHQAPCPKLLNDKTDISGDWQEANDWLEFEWLPEVVAAGLSCMAHVYSSNMMSHLSEIDLYKRAAPQLQLASFTITEAAEDWLEQCQPA